MKTHYFIITFLIFLFCNNVQAQEKINVERHQSLADAYFDDMEYDQALLLYQQLDSIAPNNTLFNYKIGVSHLYGTTKHKALDYFKNVQMLGIQDSNFYFYLAKAYHLNHQFNEAIDMYNTYLKTGATDPILTSNASRFIQQCYVGKKYVADSLNIVIKNLGSTINTQYSEYEPLISGNDSLLILILFESLFSNIVKLANDFISKQFTN